MKVHVSTDDLPLRDRISFWCDLFARQAHSFTPGEVPDASTFRAEASGHICGGFALLDIQTGLVSARRTAADVAGDRRDGFYVRRFRRPMVWKAAPRSTPVDVVHEAGDFCVSSTEWRFDAESKGAAWFEMLVIPGAALSPLLAGGRLKRPFRLPAATPLASLLGAAIDARESAGSAPSRRARRRRAAQPLGPGGAGVRRLRRGRGAGSGLAAGRAARRAQAAHRAQSGQPRPHARQRRRSARHLGAPAASSVRADRRQFRDTCRAKDCSSAATRSPARPEPAGPSWTSRSAGVSTAWRHSIGRLQTSLAPPPSCSARRRVEAIERGRPGSSAHRACKDNGGSS